MRVLVPVAALLLSVAILLTGNGLQGVLLPVRANIEGFSTFAIGLIASSYFAGFALGSLMGARVIQSVGHIRTFIAMTAIATAIPLLHGLFVIPPVWWGTRMVSGFCFATLFMVIESWLNEFSTKQTRGAVLSAYMVINLTVLTFGQMMLPLYDPRGLELFALVAILISIAAVPVALTRSRSPAAVPATRVNVRRLLRISPVGLIGCTAVGMSNGAFWALSPTYAMDAGFDNSGIALFMSATVIGGALGQWPFGRWSDRKDRRLVLAYATLLCVLAGGLLASPLFRSGDSGNGLFVLAAVWGSAAFPAYSLTVAHANDAARPSEFVEVSGGLLLGYAVGAIFGPLIASGVMTVWGAKYLYAYCAVIHSILAIFIFYRLSRKGPRPQAERVPFADSLQSALTISPVFDESTQQALEDIEALDRNEKTPAKDRPNERTE